MTVALAPALVRRDPELVEAVLRVTSASARVKAMRRVQEAVALQAERELTKWFLELGDKAGRAAAALFAERPNLFEAKWVTSLTLSQQEQLAMNIIGSLNLATWTGSHLTPGFKKWHTMIARGTEDALRAQGVTGLPLRRQLEQEVIRWGGTRAGMLDITHETKQAIMRAIGQGIEEGLNPRQTAQLIREIVPEGRFVNAGARYRAQLIARTETLNAQRMSQLRSYQTSPTIQHAIAFDGDLWDDTCANRNGQIFTLAEAEDESNNTHPNCVLSWAPVEGVSSALPTPYRAFGDGKLRVPSVPPPPISPPSIPPGQQGQLFPARAGGGESPGTPPDTRTPPSFTSSPLDDVDELGGGISKTYQGVLTDGSKVALKERLKYAGARDNLDETLGLEHAVASVRVADYLGVPTPRAGITTRSALGEQAVADMNRIRGYDGYDPYTGEQYGIQEFTEGMSDVVRGTATESEAQRFQLLDYIIGNTDRHGNNWTFWNGRITAIDHDLVFPYESQSGWGNMFEWYNADTGEMLVGQEIPLALRRQLSAMVENESAWRAAWRSDGLTEAEIDHAFERINKLDQSGVFQSCEDFLPDDPRIWAQPYKP